MKHLISISILGLSSLSACDAATRYDTGAVVLDISEPQAFSANPETTSDFVTAYEAIESEDYTRAEALLDRALEQKPRDPYALLAMGAVHEQTGRFYSAADYYESAARYGGSSVAGLSGKSVKTDVGQGVTVASAAQQNLARLGR